MLDNWSDYVTKFIKVVPIEYKKVLHDEKMASLNAKIATMQLD